MTAWIKCDHCENYINAGDLIICSDCGNKKQHDMALLLWEVGELNELISAYQDDEVKDEHT